MIQLIMLTPIVLVTLAWSFNKWFWWNLQLQHSIARTIEECM
jgi:hypothetical protein